MKSKSFMLMIMSMGFGLVAAIGISQVMGRSSGPAAPPAQTAPVLVAAVDMEHNSLLTEENVKLEQWPVAIVPENAAKDMEQIKEMASRMALSKGMPIMMPHIVNKRTISDINIPKGSTVMAIKVNEEDSIGGLMKPGDKVNVIGFFKTKDRDGQVSKTFLKGLRVWSVNAQMTANGGSREENSTRGSAIVGVLVNERQAEAIHYVQKTGSLKLVLRGDGVEEGDDEDLDLAIFGMADGDEKVASEEPQPRSGFSLFSGPQPVETSMIVWNGVEPAKTVFKDGVLPESTFRQPSGNPGPPEFNGQDAPDGPGNFAPPRKPGGPADPGGFSESERGFEEDQYRGE